MIEPKDIKISEWNDDANRAVVLYATVNVGQRLYVSQRELSQYTAIDPRKIAVERLRRAVWDGLYGEIERRLSYCASAEELVRDVLKLVRYPQGPVDAVTVERSAERITGQRLRPGGSPV